MKTLIHTVVAIGLILGVTIANATPDITGKIVSITGAHDFDVKDNKSGKEVRLEFEVGDLKVGDTVTVKDGKLIKESANEGPQKSSAKKAK